MSFRCKFWRPITVWMLAGVLFASQGLVTPHSDAQPAAPPPPARYSVKLRYEINAPRDPHVAMYDAMVKHLRSIDFEFEPPLEKLPDTDREDPSKNELTGLLPSNKVPRLFRDVHVVSALLMPEGYKLPAAAQPVGVRLELAGGLPPGRMRELGDQVRLLLRQFGFREAVGYDHHGYGNRPFSQLVGTIPAGAVDTLLKDLRNQPAGWFAPLMARADLPTPLRNVNPVIITEVLPQMRPLVEPAEPAPRGKEDLEKISPDLWELVKGKPAQTVRLQVILAYTPDPDDRAWQSRLNAAAPSWFIEGRLGQFVTGTASAGEAANLAALPEVSVVRLAQAPMVQVDSAMKVKGDNVRALRQSGLEALHKRKFRGQGVRLAILDTDFRGWEDMAKKNMLPKHTRLVDLTTERNANLFPTPYAGDPKGTGHGSQCALAAALAAPEAQLVLLRLDPVAPFRLEQVVRRMQGEFFTAELRARRDEIMVTRAELRRQRDIILEEEKKLSEGFEDYTDIEEEYGYLGAIAGWIFSPRLLLQQRKDYQARMERQLEELNTRFRKYVDQVRTLRGIKIVASPLVWNDGYPLGDMSPLSRWFDQRPPDMPLWFQSGGNTHGQSWTGLYRDRDENGVMEFATPQTPLPAGRWTRELNFLAWQPYLGARTADLPAGARIRLAMQWREPHDPDYYARPGENDLYKTPLANLRLSLLRQQDPQGKKVPADRFDVVARSFNLPQRLEYTANHAIYEQTLEFTIDQPGRYAVRLERQRDARWMLVTDPTSGRPIMIKLEGLAPTGLRPAGTATLPALEKNWELKPRLFVDVTDPGHRGSGRPVFLDFATDLGDIGVPADAQRVVTVGAASLEDRLQPYSAAGPPANLELFRKPNIFAYDSLQLPEGGAFGSSVSTCFAAGLAAAAFSSGMTRDQFLQYIAQESGRVLIVPPQ